MPVLLFIGAWVLLMSWDMAGLAGLMLPGFLGWILLAVTVCRALTGSLWPRQQKDRQVMTRLWFWGGLCFAILVGGELFLSHGMPQAWRDYWIEALHIRRVYRQYGPP